MGNNVTAQGWFALGERIPYDRRAKRILSPGDTTDSPDVVHVFQRVVRDGAAVWTTFLPGFPDGSFGWVKVDEQLSGNGMTPRLYVEFVGQGDSDKPAEYPYGTMERADLVQALWEAEGIRKVSVARAGELLRDVGAQETGGARNQHPHGESGFS